MRDFPTSCPNAFRKVYAMAPPTKIVSALLMIFSINDIFVLILDPPIINVKGFFEFSILVFSYLISSRIKNPNPFLGKKFVIPTFDAWDLCAVPNASLI